MSTIFPREEKAEQIFDEILKNPRACERLKDTFFAAIPSAEESEGAGTDIPGTVFAAALFNAYENKDLSAFMMAVCNNSVFDLLRNSFLIPIRFNDKGVENPIFLTDENGNLHLYGICLVAGLGGANRRPGNYDYYMSDPVVKDDAKGVGPFLLAYTEMLRLKK